MLIREFKTKNFRVVVTAEEEFEAPDLSWDDTGEVAEKIDSGEYTLFCAKAAVYFQGQEVATDYLGGCIYEDPADFQDHKGRNIPTDTHPNGYGSYFSDMVRTVCKEARERVQEMKVELEAIQLRKN